MPDIKGPTEFEDLHFTDLVRDSSATRFFYSAKWSILTQIEAHPEPQMGR